MTEWWQRLDRRITLEVVRVTEAAAVSAFRHVGRGDETLADHAATVAMRKALNGCEIDGIVVIGEGERDEAPMLYIGEKVGTGRGPKVDIALDPLEGTTLTAKAMQNALTVVAVAEAGTMLHAPDTYMDKIAIGPGYPEGVVDLDASAEDNIHALAKAKGVKTSEITACILDRPRHHDIIAAVRGTGAAIRLITDGDVAGVIHTADPLTGIDIYMGQGGAPEGVLAAAALQCVGGQIQGRLVFRKDEEVARAERCGITDLKKKYALTDMVSGECVFAATGVTHGSMLRGVRIENGLALTHSVVMRSATKTVRWLETRKPIYGDD